MKLFTLGTVCIYSCGNVNFARRVECNKCGAPAPSGTGGDRGGGGGRDSGRSYESSRYDGGSRSSGGSGGSYGSNNQHRDRDNGSYGQGPTPPPLAAIPSYDGSGSYPPPPSGYGMEAVPPPSSYSGGPPSYGGPTRGYGGSAPSDGGDAPAEKVKQCDENCDETCDNARIYISNLPPDVTVDELKDLFGGIGQVITLVFFTSVVFFTCWNELSPLPWILVSVFVYWCADWDCTSCWIGWKNQAEAGLQRSVAL